MMKQRKLANVLQTMHEQTANKGMNKSIASISNSSYRNKVKSKDF
jgi:hypothetical protein